MRTVGINYLDFRTEHVLIVFVTGHGIISKLYTIHVYYGSMDTVHCTVLYSTEVGMLAFFCPIALSHRHRVSKM